MTRIIDYEPRFGGQFKSLNLEWLNKFNLLETHDVEVLEDPEGQIIRPGGFIYLAVKGERVVGTAAIARVDEACFELAKMSVDPDFQGQGIGKLLIAKCLEKAKELGTRKLILYSNSQLHTAISIYRKFGFKHVAVLDSPFVTADVKMELEIG